MNDRQKYLAQCALGIGHGAPSFKINSYIVSLVSPVYNEWEEMRKAGWANCECVSYVCFGNFARFYLSEKGIYAALN